jgi:hypothetical protein
MTDVHNAYFRQLEWMPDTLNLVIELTFTSEKHESEKSKLVLSSLPYDF